MDQFANSSLPNSPMDPSLNGLCKRARVGDSLSRFARPQDFGTGSRPTVAAEIDPGVSQDLDRCDDSKPGKKSVMSHVATEQRRRDRINEGFNALRDLIPHKDKMDKATFLQQTVEYIKQLQAVMHQLLAMGAIKNLPEETQWSIRLLLPRKTEDVSITTAANAAPAAQQLQVPAVSSSSAMMTTQYLPYMMQPQQPSQQQQQQPPQPQQPGMTNQNQIQAPDGSNILHTQLGQQLPQQQAQQPPSHQQAAQNQQMQQVVMPTHSATQTLELKAPNNPGPTVQLDLNNMLQIQALLQQNQMQLQAQQQAARQLWSAGQEANPWNMSQQLQQMMQPQLASAGLQLHPDTINMLANQQAITLLLPQAAAPQQACMTPNPPSQQAPTQMVAHQPSNAVPVGQQPIGAPPAGPSCQPTGQVGHPTHLLQSASEQLPQMVTQVMSPPGAGCGSSSQPSSSEPSSPDKLDARGPAKLRKTTKVRRHTTASKIAKPPTGQSVPSGGTGRPEALSLSS